MKQNTNFIRYIQVLIAVVLTIQAATHNVPRRHGRCSDGYQCLDTTVCFPTGWECDGANDCSDGSDESHCELSSGPCPAGYFECNCGHCLKKDAYCDGVFDCFDGEDEKDCEIKTQNNQKRDLMESAARFNGNSMGSMLNNQKQVLMESAARFNGSSMGSMLKAKNKLLNSILTAASSQKNESKINVWQLEPHRISISLYMSNSSIDESTWRELSYETSNRLLSKLSRHSLKDIYSSDLALYVNAFLVLCIDPRNFYSRDLVSELKQRSRGSQYVSPLAMLARCNAHDTITEDDVTKLVDIIKNPQINSWTDSQALAIMALACAVKQDSFDQAQLDDLTLEIKRKQFRNGTVENIKTTALVLQALFASQNAPDEDNFDEEKAVAQILRVQQPDGSFGSSVDDYYIMPVLTSRSLVNVSDSHCKKAAKDPREALHKVVNFSGAKKTVHYSIWIGDDISLERDLKLKVPVNSSLYTVLELAADLDAAFRCKYNVRELKPYVYKIANLQDDPERETFWFLYSNASDSNNAILLTESPAKIIPKNKDHFAFWYRRGQWHVEKTAEVNEASKDEAESD